MKNEMRPIHKENGVTEWQDDEALYSLASVDAFTEELIDSFYPHLATPQLEVIPDQDTSRSPQ